VLGAVLPGEDVLKHAEPPHVGHHLAELLTELPVDGVRRVLAELHVPAQRPLEPRLGRLGHQQRPVPRPPDDRHRLDDLPLAAHQPFVPRPTDEFPPLSPFGMTKFDIAALERAYAGE
jgi:hypothetical protein